MKLQELYDKRANLVQQARDLNDRVGKENRDLNAEEAEQFKRINDEIDELKNRIDREVRLAELDKEMKEPRDPNPPKLELADGDPKGDYLERAKAARSTDEYCDAFMHVMRYGKDKLTREQAEILHNPELRALEVGTASEGGNIVPTDFERKLYEIAREANIMRQLADVITATHDRDIPTVSTLPTCTWVAEEGAYQENDPAFGTVALASYKAGAIVKVSEELVADSAFDLAAELTRLYGDAQAALEEAAYVNGDGSGKPTGIVVGSTLGVTAAAEAAITPDELMELYHSPKRRYRRNGTWLAADATILAIRKLKDGNQQYIWQPGLQAGQPDRLLGKPIYAADDMPAMTTGLKSVIFGDFRYYRIMDRVGILIQRLDELYAANGQVGFRFAHRTEGKLILAEAVYHLIQA